MKKILKEQLQRIHRLNYGKQALNEGFLDNILGKKDEKKADVVEPDVQKFFDTLETASQGNGISQQERGSMTFQKEVESMQIGLILLGYELPRFGVDGLFGPETASAVRKFKSEKVAKTPINEAFVEIGDTNYPNVKVDNDSRYDQVNDELLADLQRAGESSGVVATITTASTGHSKYTTTGNESRHGFGTAVDIAILNGVGFGNSSFKQYGDKLKDALVSLGYSWNNESGNAKAVLWQTSIGGNHYNHLHVSNKQGVSGGPGGGGIEVATPEMLTTLIQLLKERGITSAEIQKYTNIGDLNYTGTTDTEFYQTLLQVLQAPVTQENMKFLMAWRQAEGKAGRFNPFNTTYDLPGSSNFNSVGVKNYQTSRDGLVATVKTLKNGRYECILNGLRNDLGADRIAQCESLKTWGTGELVAKVVSSYNAGAKPKIASLA
jgi:peptidoglycan hydrolase-like protein with peptidoglycan-binding domain